MKTCVGTEETVKQINTTRCKLTTVFLSKTALITIFLGMDFVYKEL